MKKKDTLVIIPAFNEESSIGMVVDGVFDNCSDSDILVVNDGSSDKTTEALIGKNIFVASHIFNIGTGASFQTGCLFAAMQGYNYIVRMDGDGQHSHSFIDRVLLPVKNNEADIVIGSRFLGESEFKSSLFRQIGISIINFILTFIAKKKITDPTSGFCSMNRRAFEFFSKNCAEDYPEPEIMVQANFRIMEVPISMAKRYAGSSSITPARSIYYMIKVLLSLFIIMIRKERR